MAILVGLFAFASLSWSVGKTVRVYVEGITHEVLAKKTSGMLGWYIVESPLSGRCYELLNGISSMAMAKVR
ncbi:MAG: hypothetical protein G01um101448_675 [Parcubacteria group bacterium Gr01-1014_48]|nr:MAG: hypothetical protein Greene041614_772 [Parcubacteria group bacterium Greene0416_14]TSC73624.1 MAG: hypothetical protein G01um101448_675 [Parcubacteria group bacterium Gr01-1014_48]TSD00902.1 MAG: hypothetical protein Greene101415_616 [Parcubacteria group bacterium Greene1014_15]TSD07984.1 MAG: hypothetical protein Greene07144_525 [Parcubacteria group bacterium Greene0714_4]